MRRKFLSVFILVVACFSAILLTGCGGYTVSDVRSDFLKKSQQEFQDKYSKEPFEIEFDRLAGVVVNGWIRKSCIYLRDKNNSDFSIVANFDFDKFADTLAEYTSDVTYQKPIRIKGVVKQTNPSGRTVFMQCTSISPSAENNDYVVAHKYTFESAEDDFIKAIIQGNDKIWERLLNNACSFKGRVEIFRYIDIGLVAESMDRLSVAGGFVIPLDTTCIRLYNFDAQEFRKIFDKQEVEFVGRIYARSSSYNGLGVAGARIIPTSEQKRKLDALMSRYKTHQQTKK